MGEREHKVWAGVLQAVIVLAGLAILTFLLWEPHLEGRNANATPAQIYFTDPFLAYVYVASLSVFAALYQAFQALKHIRQGQALSQDTVRALRAIKHCALAMTGFAMGGEAFLLLGAVSPGDDRAGGIVMGALVILSALVMAAAASVSAHVLHDAMRRASSDVRHPARFSGAAR